MQSITSISGGKTSCYMAIHYPTDRSVFAVVLTDDPACRPKDPGLLREAQARLPHFQGSRELDQTLINVLRLEQDMGRAIDWVAAPYTYDKLIANLCDEPGLRSGHAFLPNSRRRLCTEHLKIAPIFEYWWQHCAPSMAVMHIGLRWDEPRRVEGWTCDKDRYRYATHCNIGGNRRRVMAECEWRVSEFPLYRDRVTTAHIQDYWHRRGWEFPPISNCDFCFFHRPLQQQRQYLAHPERAQWWLDWEDQTGQTFGVIPLESLLRQQTLPIWEEEACFCTD